MGATQVSMDRRINKENAVYTYIRILFSLEKVGNLFILQHQLTMRTLAKWNKPIRNRQILHDSTYVYSELSKPQRQKKNGGCKGLRGGEKEELLLLCNGYRASVLQTGKRSGNGWWCGCTIWMYLMLLCT